MSKMDTRKAKSERNRNRVYRIVNGRAFGRGDNCDRFLLTTEVMSANANPLKLATVGVLVKSNFGKVDEALSTISKLDSDVLKREVERYRNAMKGKDLYPLKIYMPKKAYEQSQPEFIRKKEVEYHCEIIPLDESEMKRIDADSIVLHYKMPEPDIDSHKFVLVERPTYIFPGNNKVTFIEPKDFRKKKKAKRRQQKQARRKNK